MNRRQILLGLAAAPLVPAFPIAPTGVAGALAGQGSFATKAYPVNGMVLSQDYSEVMAIIQETILQSMTLPKELL